jgi:glycine hydroxymethyltransferase
MGALEELRDVSRICRTADTWRSETINLIASENVLSSAARRLLDSDFHHRYAEGHPGDRYYEGTQYIDEIEARTARLVSEIFKAARVDVRLPSATMANEATFSALLKEGGTALAHGVAGGGHISHAKFGALGKHADRILPLPICEDGFRLDAPAARDLIQRERPRLVVLGRSLFLFPEPIEELKPACDEVGAILLYDGSHVLGLIAGGTFQDPLAEGADLMTASTHKTYFGPQRGIVVGRPSDDAFWKRIDRAVFPGVTSNRGRRGAPRRRQDSLPPPVRERHHHQHEPPARRARAQRSGSARPPPRGPGDDPVRDGGGRDGPDRRPDARLRRLGQGRGG